MYICIEMPECRTVWQPVSPVPDGKKLTMPELVRYRTKLTQSGIFLVCYRTKIRDAGMPMPVSFLDADAQLRIYGILCYIIFQLDLSFFHYLKDFLSVLPSLLLLADSVMKFPIFCCFVGVSLYSCYFGCDTDFFVGNTRACTPPRKIDLKKNIDTLPRKIHKLFPGKYRYILALRTYCFFMKIYTDILPPRRIDTLPKKIQMFS
jgi:hypothetical protein